MPSYTHAWLVVIFVTREWSNCLVHNKIVFKHRKLTFGPFFFLLVLVFVILIYVSKKLRKGAWIIWHVVILIVWKMRNDRIFNNKICGVDDMVEQIKTLA